MTAQALIHKAEILEQVENGVHLSVIAKSVGITKGAISQQLADDKEYQAARMLGLQVRLEQRETEIEQAPDMLNLARAKELLSQARWRCETEGKAIWSKQQTTINVQINQVADIDKELYSDARSELSED